MFETESPNARARLAVWYVESLRPRVVEAVRERGVSGAVAAQLEENMRALFGVAEPQAHAVRVDVRDRPR